MVSRLSPSACDLFEKSNLAIHFDLEVHILNMRSQNEVTRGAKQCFQRAKQCFQRGKQCFERVVRVKTVF